MAMGIKKEFIEEIFKAIAMIHFEEPKDLVAEPEEGTENYEDAKDPIIRDLNQGCPHMVRSGPSGRTSLGFPTLIAYNSAVP